MERKKQYIYYVVELAVLFTICIIFAFVKNITDYPYDSNYYWTIGDTIFEGGFDFLSFPETFRGYFFPFLISAFKQIFGSLGWKIFSSLMVSIMFGMMLPSFFEREDFGGKRILRDVLALLAFLFVWGNFIQYPLSDFPAFMFLVLGLLLCKFVVKNQNMNILFIISSMLAGGMLYAAYNTRAAYLYAGVVAVLYTINSIKKWKKALLSVLAIALGMCIFAMPQCFINKKYVGTYSPKVFTEQVYGYAYNLQITQVKYGFLFSRYETYYNESEGFTDPVIYFNDKTGEEIYKRENLEYELSSLKDVIKVICKYPLDMIGVYGRHLFSLMTPVYNDVFVHSIFSDKGLLIFVSILLWIILGLSIVLNMNKKKKKKYLIWIIISMIPSLLQLAGMSELRFFLPAYVLLYTYDFTKIDFIELWDYYKERLWATISVVALISILWVSLIGSILGANSVESRSDKNILINDSPQIVHMEDN